MTTHNQKPTFLRMSEQNLSGKRVLIRQDLNVPVKNGKITNDARLRAALPTIKSALDAGAAVMICSHLGRPKAGSFDKALSLQPVAEYLSSALDMPVPLISDYLERGVSVASGGVVLLENVRFCVGEKQNDAALAKSYAELCDIYVMDAFGTAHRSEASTEGVAHHAAIACAGPLLANELDALGAAMHNPKKPMIAIVGGSKVSTKLEVLKSLALVCDKIIVGGGIANTFIAAAGFSVGRSLYEPELIEVAQQIAQKVDVPLPSDVVVIDASQLDPNQDFLTAVSKPIPMVKSITDIGDNDMILDIGTDSAHEFASQLASANTILWNGPVGVFEVDAFGNGTQTIAQTIYENKGFSIAGGGDTLAAVDKYKVAAGISYISTGGGAFLEFVEGKVLPAVAALTKRAT